MGGGVWLGLDRERRVWLSINVNRQRLVWKSGVSLPCEAHQRQPWLFVPVWPHEAWRKGLEKLRVLLDRAFGLVAIPD